MLKKIVGTLSLIVIISSIHAKTNNNFVASNGTLNLGISNVLETSSIKLQGDWEFYWNQLYDPKDFKETNKIIKPIYGKIPKSWTTYTINGNKLPSTGYATYRLIVHKKSDTEKTIYGLKVSTIFSSSLTLPG